jgi:hypothetical protein
MGRRLSLLTIGLLLVASLGVVDSGRAQEATPAAGRQSIDFQEGEGEGEEGGRRIVGYSPDGTVLAVWERGDFADQLRIVEVASLLIAQGVHVKVVADILGHAQLSTTSDIYSHIFPSAHRDVAYLMDEILLARTR